MGTFHAGDPLPDSSSVTVYLQVQRPFSPCYLMYQTLWGGGGLFSEQGKAHEVNYACLEARRESRELGTMPGRRGMAI